MTKMTATLIYVTTVYDHFFRATITMISKLDAWDGLRYFIVALPEPSIFWYEASMTGVLQSMYKLLPWVDLDLLSARSNEFSRVFEWGQTVTKSFNGEKHL